MFFVLFCFVLFSFFSHLSQKTEEWRELYLAYHSQYPETLRSLAKMSLSIFEMDRFFQTLPSFCMFGILIFFFFFRITRLLASPLKRLHDYYTFYGNLSTKDYQEISGVEIQERMNEFQFVMGKCQEVMCLYYLKNIQ